jgi:hypothetical protein
VAWIVDQMVSGSMSRREAVLTGTLGDSIKPGEYEKATRDCAFQASSYPVTRTSFLNTVS